MKTTLDESQKPVVAAQNGYYLVLAPPGCGKTHLLAERICRTLADGVQGEDMLCLTFTNRAAREMQQRISNRKAEVEAFSQQIDDIYIGNIHRFCSKFLFDENVVEADSVIIEDEEAVSIIADIRNEDETAVMNDFNRNRSYQQIIFFSHLMEQIAFGHPQELYLHPEVLTNDDVSILRKLASSQRWNKVKVSSIRELLLLVYQQPQLYFDDADNWLLTDGDKLRSLLWKMDYARGYADYKKLHHMLDFEDLLLRTYQVLVTESEHRKYRWIQVDEVQDLNAMQLAIIDLLTDENPATVMYLGDEQQAIFSFMGAKVEMLDKLKERCQGNIFHLTHNHRSPSYLLEVFNSYAEKQLHIDPRLLPKTDFKVTASEKELRILHSSTIDTEVRDVAEMAMQLHHANPEETTAVIVSSNMEAEKISEEMASMSISHFKVSGRDLFTTPGMKLLLSHLSILANDLNMIAWARLLKGVGVLPTHPLARRFVYKLKQLAMTPSDFLKEKQSTYVADFLNVYQHKDLVVFDTETTGVDLLQDDVVEISAIRVRNGVVERPFFDVYLKTDKELPDQLGDKPNPLKAVYEEKRNKGELMNPSDAFDAFFQFVGDSAVVGHNVGFDIQMVRQNSERPDAFDNQEIFDTLKLSKLLFPGLHRYKLESLLEVFHLEGENSHMSIDDVDATINLMNYCHQKSVQIVDSQVAFMSHPKVLPYINKVRANYLELYQQAKARMGQVSQCGLAEDRNSIPMLINEISASYEYMRDRHYVDDIPKLPYLLNYLQKDVITEVDRYPSLAMQLSRYMLDLNTMKESDFCNSRGMKERIYVTTVHKAKGLEFDNVIVFDAVEGRYPSWRNKSSKADEEDARKFYVAISRAKRRLVIAFGMESTDRYGHVRNHELTPFMNGIMRYFNS